MARVSNILLTYQQMVRGKNLSDNKELDKAKVIGLVHLFNNIKDVRMPGMILYPHWLFWRVPKGVDKRGRKKVKKARHGFSNLVYCK